MATSVTCHYITFIAVVYMRSHCKRFQDRELMWFFYLKFVFTSQGKWICAVAFGIRHLYDTSVRFKLKTSFQYVLYFLWCVYGTAEMS